MLLRYEELSRCRGSHEGGITSVAFSVDGTYIATAGMDGKVCLWDPVSGDLRHSYSTSTPVLSLAWTGVSNAALLCGLHNGSLALLEVTDRKLLVTGTWAHRYPVECLAVSGTRLATGAHKEAAVWNWNPAEHKYDRELDLKEPATTSQNQPLDVIVTSLHWTSTQRHPTVLFISYMHHGILLLDGTNYQCIRAPPLNGLIARADLSPNGALYAVSNLTQGFDVYSIESDAPIASFPYSVGELYPVPVLFAHGGRALVGGSTVGEVDMWYVASKRQMHGLPAQSHRNRKILALAAHYAQASDRFYIATATFNEDGGSRCTIWATQAREEEDEGVAAEEDDASSDSQGCSMCTTIVVVSIFLVMVLLLLTPEPAVP